MKAHEAALLRRVGRRLRRRLQPLAHGGGVVGRRLLRDEAVDRAQLVEDLDAGRRALGRLEPRERALVRSRLGLDVTRDRRHELAAPAALGVAEHRLERRRRLLEGLDRTTGIGQRDGHACHERRALEPRPFLVGEVGLRRHVRLLGLGPTRASGSFRLILAGRSGRGPSGGGRPALAGRALGLRARRAGGDDGRDEAQRDPEGVVGDRVGDVHGTLPSWKPSVASTGPQEAAEQVEQQERAQAHAAVADGGVDERGRNGQEVGEHHRPRAEAPLEAVQARQAAPGPLAVAAEQPDEDAIAPAPARPPEQPVEHHQAGEPEHHGEHERRLADAGARAHVHDRGRRRAHQLQQRRVRGAQRREQRQQHQPVEPGDRDAADDDPVGALHRAVPRRRQRAAPAVGPERGGLVRLAGALLVHGDGVVEAKVIGSMPLHRRGRRPRCGAMAAGTGSPVDITNDRPPAPPRAGKAADERRSRRAPRRRRGARARGGRLGRRRRRRREPGEREGRRRDRRRRRGHPALRPGVPARARAADDQADRGRLAAQQAPLHPARRAAAQRVRGVAADADPDGRRRLPLLRGRGEAVGAGRPARTRTRRRRSANRARSTRTRWSAARSAPTSSSRRRSW